MAASPTVPDGPDEAPLSAARQRRISKSAHELADKALDILASAGSSVPGMAAGNPDLIRSAALPVGAAQTMLGVQKFRLNWYTLPRETLGRLARLVVQRNWFARPVHALRHGIYAAGFSFQGEEARLWAGGSAYPFRQVHNDMLHEWLVSDAVIAYWRKDPPPGTLPMIEIPDTEDVHYEVCNGIPQIRLTVKRNSSIREDLRERLGSQLWTCIKNGSHLVIRKGDPDGDFDFEIMKTGKSTSPLDPPAITGVLDDLDFIEAVRVGDWNGAWSRREIIRQTKKGTGVSSGPNAGTSRNNAKYNELQSILKQMKSILGKTDLATNYDQEIDWLLFSKEFFDPEMIAAAKQRLLFWAGISGVLLLKTDSQITGLSAFLMDRLRTEVTTFREDFSGFLQRVFGSESFRAHFPDMPPLVPQWSVKPLYSSKALIELTNALALNGLAAPQSLRGLMDIDDAAESALMRAAHARREDFTPPYEPRQGLLPGLFPGDFTKPGSAGAPPPGEPGRPAAE